MAGIRLAARLGFEAVEFDVMLTADGVPILMHDETLERTSDGRGRVADHEWPAIARLDAGARFHPAWAGEPVPRLDEALALCARLGLAANVEIKPAAGQDSRTGQVVAETVRRQWPAGLPVLLSSFSEPALAAARDAAPELPRALLLESLPGNWRERLQALAGLALHVHAAALASPALAEVLRAGVPVAVYTVNSMELAQSCFDAGVAAVFTDRLDRRAAP